MAAATRTRRWWILGGLKGSLSQEYHYIPDGQKLTACGLNIPIGRFVTCVDTPEDCKKKRG